WVEREMLAGYLLDVAGAYRWLSGAEGSGPLDRVPALLREAREGEAAPAAREEPPPLLTPTRPVEWVASSAALAAACERLREERVIGLDVETTLSGRVLCLVQLAGAERVYL